jgi:LPXTG-site transpeptidase (sortase) family protein
VDVDDEQATEQPGVARRRLLALGAAAAAAALVGGLPAGAAGARGSSAGTYPAGKTRTRLGATGQTPRLGNVVLHKFGVRKGLYYGVDMPTLDIGPGLWPGTAFPGTIGKTVVMGHRTSKHAVFRYIDLFVPGDIFTFEMPNGHFNYRVHSKEIVNPVTDAKRILQQVGWAQASLIACHPPGSTSLRYVVHGLLI